MNNCEFLCVSLALCVAKFPIRPVFVAGEATEWLERPVETYESEFGPAAPEMSKELAEAVRLAPE